MGIVRVRLTAVTLIVIALFCAEAAAWDWSEPRELINPLYGHRETGLRAVSAPPMNRIFVEKKSEFNAEAKHLFHDIKASLALDTPEALRRELRKIP